VTPSTLPYAYAVLICTWGSPMPMWLFYVNASGLLEEPEVLQTQDNDSMDKMADIKFKWR